MRVPSWVWRLPPPAANWWCRAKHHSTKNCSANLPPPAQPSPAQPSPAQAPNFAEFPFERLCLECSSSSSGGGHSYVVQSIHHFLRPAHHQPPPARTPPLVTAPAPAASTSTSTSSQQPDQRHVSCKYAGAVSPAAAALRVIYDPAVCCSPAAVAPHTSRDATSAAAPLQHCSRPAS